MQAINGCSNKEAARRAIRNTFSQDAGFLNGVSTLDNPRYSKQAMNRVTKEQRRTQRAFHKEGEFRV